MYSTTGLILGPSHRTWQQLSDIPFQVLVGRDANGVFAALAEFERDILRQRVNAGLKAARRRGRVGGRPKALDEADLKKARALLHSGEYTRVQVAEELEVSRHTLWRALSQETAK